MENTKECVRTYVCERFIEIHGKDLFNKVESLTDIELLSVHNYCLAEYYEFGGEIFTSLDILVFVYQPRKPLEFARAIYEGSGDDCFNPDNWVYCGPKGQVEALTPKNRRDYIMCKLCQCKPEYIEVSIKELGLLDND